MSDWLKRALCRAVICCGVAGAHEASAHPHVWVAMKTDILFAADGSVSGVRHAWTFDEMYSAFATQGVAHKQKGAFTREELAPLAQTNMDVLKESNFFTFAKADEKKVPFGEPVDYWNEYNKRIVTLHFTLPLKTPVKAHMLQVDVYDSTIFVDFAFAKKYTANLVGAPAECKVSIEQPRELTAAEGQRLGEAFFNALSSGNSWAAQYANKILVICP
jgi:ABC-type uncharacterized transport system substrate-binding protein